MANAQVLNGKCTNLEWRMLNSKMHNCWLANAQMLMEWQLPQMLQMPKSQMHKCQKCYFSVCILVCLVRHTSRNVFTWPRMASVFRLLHNANVKCNSKLCTMLQMPNAPNANAPNAKCSKCSKCKCSKCKCFKCLLQFPWRYCVFAGGNNTALNDVDDLAHAATAKAYGAMPDGTRHSGGGRTMSADAADSKRVEMLKMMPSQVRFGSVQLRILALWGLAMAKLCNLFCVFGRWQFACFCVCGPASTIVPNAKCQMPFPPLVNVKSSCMYCCCAEEENACSYNVYSQSILCASVIELYRIVLYLPVPVGIVLFRILYIYGHAYRIGFQHCNCKTRHINMAMHIVLFPLTIPPILSSVYCIVLYCIALYCIVLHCIVLHSFALYCIVLHCIVLYRRLVMQHCNCKKKTY